MSQATNLQDMTDQQLLDELVRRGVLRCSEGIQYNQWSPSPPPRVECSANFFRHREGEMWSECCKVFSPPTHIFYQAEIPIRELPPPSSHPTDRSQDAQV